MQRNPLLFVSHLIAFFSLPIEKISFQNEIEFFPRFQFVANKFLRVIQIEGKEYKLGGISHSVFSRSFDCIDFDNFNMAELNVLLVAFTVRYRKNLGAADSLRLRALPRKKIN